VRIASHPPDDECLGVITPPVGCYPTDPMSKTLTGGVYEVQLGGERGSLISLPLLDHGTFQATATAVSPTGTADYPLPVDW
jgi:hypothetical protein